MCRISAFLPATINSLPRFFSRNRVRIFPKEQLPFILQNNLLLCVVNGELHVKMTSILSLPCLSFPSAVSLYPQTTFLLASCPCQTKSNSAFFLYSTSLSLLPPPKCNLTTLQWKESKDSKSEMERGRKRAEEECQWCRYLTFLILSRVLSSSMLFFFCFCLYLSVYIALLICLFKQLTQYKRLFFSSNSKPYIYTRHTPWVRVIVCTRAVHMYSHAESNVK